MKVYDFVITLNGAVSAENSEQALKQINAHIDELGKIDSTAQELSWDNVEIELEQE